MDEQRLQTILGQKLEVPDMINKKLEETYAQLEGRRRPAKRRGVRPVRTALIAAALVAALCVTATAAYNYYIRQSVPVDEGQTVQGIVGGGQPSWDEEQVYDEHGKLEHNWYNRQTVPADPNQAMALLGDYLPECGYQWQIEDFTLTVEGYALDEHTGTAKFYYTVEHPGGFPEDAVDWQHGYLNYTANILYVTFESMSDTDWSFSFGGRTYVDVERSTPEKLCLVDSGAAIGAGWKAEDGVRIRFSIPGEEHQQDVGGKHIISRDDPRVEGALELPGVKSLPAISASDPAAGRAVELSAIGLKLNCEDMDMVGYVALDYADGARYVVYDRAGNLDNADYVLGGGERPDMVVRYVFNRLVDPSQVAAVIVDGQRYEVN